MISILNALPVDISFYSILPMHFLGKVKNNCCCPFLSKPSILLQLWPRKNYFDFRQSFRNCTFFSNFLVLYTIIVNHVFFYKKTLRFHDRSKHINICYYILRDQLANKQLYLKYTPKYRQMLLQSLI